MKILSIVFFSGAVVFLILTFKLVMTGGSFHLHLVTRVVDIVPLYLLLTAAALLLAGFVSAFAPHP